MTTSHSIRHSAATDFFGVALSGGTSRLSQSDQHAASVFSQGHPVSSAVQIVHGLHRDQHGEFVARLSSGTREPELQLPSAVIMSSITLSTVYW